MTTWVNRTQKIKKIRTAKCRMSGDLVSLIQDLIPEAMSGQNFHVFKMAAANLDAHFDSFDYGRTAASLTRLAASKIL